MNLGFFFTFIVLGHEKIEKERKEKQSNKEQVTKTKWNILNKTYLPIRWWSVRFVRVSPRQVVVVMREAERGVEILEKKLLPVRVRDICEREAYQISLNVGCG
jgi:hypothetical protein